MGKRIIPRRRGKGSSLYRSPSHKHHFPVAYPKIEKAEGIVTSITHSPGHTAPVAEIKYDTGEKTHIFAPDGLQLNQKVYLGFAPIEKGNVLPIGQIPEGTLIYNIEAVPGDGGKLVRAAGTAATVVSHGIETLIQLPSGQFKSLNPRCRATIGVISGSGRKEKPFAKSGKKYYTYRSKAKIYLKVRGIAMNPVSHPHGGGSHQHVGRPSTISSRAPPGRKVGRLAPKRRRK